MKISIIHPTRGRKQQALNTCAKWMRYADNPWAIEYIFSIDTDDKDILQPLVIMIPKLESNREVHLQVIKNNNHSAIEAINNAAKIATGDLLVVISDDMTCEEHWDTLLLEAVKGKEDFLLKTDDGLQKTLVTLPIMDRKYYERFGYVYHPDYSHMFADQELTAVAIMTGKYVKLPLLFEHLHYSTGKTPKDAINSKNDATWQQGERLFNERLKSNFGIENPVIPYSEIVWR